jgi:hypothetical protein
MKNAAGKILPAMSVKEKTRENPKFQLVVN